jgi:hypothetical protein
VDYSVRTHALKITLGDDAIAIAPKAQITAVKKASLVDNDSFTISDGTTTTTFAYDYSGTPTFAHDLMQLDTIQSCEIRH